MHEQARHLLSSLSRLGTAMGLAAALVCGAAVTPTLAQSVRTQLGDDDRSSGQRGAMRVSDVRRMGVLNGYSEGYEHGLEDRASRAAFGFRNDDVFKHALSGYDVAWGFEREYQNSFRNGYEQGYPDGYHNRGFDRGFDRSQVFKDYRHDPFYGYPSYRSDRGYVVVGPAYRSDAYDWDDDDPESDEIAARAARQGRADGFARGQHDRSLGVRRPNPQGHGAFSNALNGWDPSWGSAGGYRQQYRAAFLEGYWTGYGRR